MQINLTDILYQEEPIEKKKLFIPIKELSFGNQKVQLNGDVAVEIQFIKTGTQELLLEGIVEATLLLHCDRCNEIANYPIKADFSKEVTVDALGEDEESFIEGNIIDLEKLVVNEIYLNFPMKILCKEDCNGICFQCGTNLNHGECGCDRTDIDPRFSGLKALFDEKFKEV